MLLKKNRLARQDILDSAKYIAKENPKDALQFLNALEETTELLKTSPRIGSLKTISNGKI